MYSTFKTKYGSPFSIKARKKDEEKNSTLFLHNKGLKISLLISNNQIFYIPFLQAPKKHPV